MTEHVGSAEGAEVVETGEGKFQLRIRAGGVEFLADEPRAVGGLGSGPNPYDLLSSALGACTAMTLRLYADRKGWSLAQVGVQVLHTSNGGAGTDQFSVEIRLEGELSADQRARLLEIANKCPVHLTLEQGSTLTTRLAVDPPGPYTANGSHQHMADMEQAAGT